MSLVRSMQVRLQDEEGQTFVEYALILAVVVVGVLLAVTWTGLGGDPGGDRRRLGCRLRASTRQCRVTRRERGAGLDV